MHLHFRQLLCASTCFLAIFASAEEGTLREISEHGRQEVVDTPVGDMSRTGVCVKNTARQCKSLQNVGNVVEHLTQCVSGGAHPFLGASHEQQVAAQDQAQCSADVSATPSGTCMCGVEYCADTDMLCHRGGYQVLNEAFSIEAKAFPGEKLYMTPDGKVMVGQPPDPRAAKWHISVTGRGAKILWTDLYADRILQEYERCDTVTDVYGLTFTKCEMVVGAVQDPQAGEMGWSIELFTNQGASVQNAIMDFAEVDVQLRSLSSWDMFYISPTTKEGMACEGRGRNCPGVSGAFRFDPPLAGRMDFKLDEAPGYLPPGLASYAVTVGLAVLALCCLTCVFTMDTSTKSLLAGCCLIPIKEMAACAGFRGQGAKI